MMKKLYLTILLLMGLMPTEAPAQNANLNYVRTRTMLSAGADSCLDRTVYFDGLGRPFQTLWKGITPDKKNLVDLQEYDQAGRAWKAWNPVYAAAANNIPKSTFATAASSTYGDSRSYTETAYEASPLNRTAREYGPGTDWEEHPTRKLYLSNSTTSSLLKCLRYSVNTDGSLNANGGALYPAGVLYVIEENDEDGNRSFTFTDKEGHLLLERRLNGTTTHDTYYVYDIYGNLRYVLQPMYQQTADLAKYAFQYTYDNRNRCTRKQMPGTEYVEYVYDNYDRLTFSQDGKQRVAGRWTYYQYDKFNRLTVQGECTGKNASASPTVHVRNYYDSYDFAGTTGFPTTQFTKDTSEYGKGMLTGSEYTVFSGTSTGGKIYEAHYYDAKSREVKSVRSNLLGGYEVTETTYSFTGNPLTVTHRHTATGKTAHTEVYTYTYDHADRVSKVEHTLDGAKVTLAAYTYDNLGRLKQKNLHGLWLHRMQYTYNVRGWLTGISTGFFGESLYYQDGDGTPCYNGNISSVKWNFNGPPRDHCYRFSYDGLNQLTEAAYTAVALVPELQAGDFTERVTGYDRNGNILGLQRYGQTGATTHGLIDNLTYTLDGNRVTRVDDAVTATAYNNGFEFKDAVKQANEYTYDANGNLTKDLNRNISNIQYNSLNLPSVVTFTDGSTVTYTYATDGAKLRTVHKTGTTTVTTDYCGTVLYENGTQKMLLTDEGYVTLPDKVYHYFQKDHLGNVRLVIGNPTSSSGNIKERNNYYAFGGLIPELDNVQPYKYNGKELDTYKGLNWHDYGARHYDAALGRWHTVDPMAEKYYPTSPYGYCLNNPVKYIDPNGKDVVITIDKENGSIIVQSVIILTGQYATQELAQQYQTDIMNNWGAMTSYEYEGVNYDVTWDVSVRVAEKGEKKVFNGINNYMEVYDPKMDINEQISKVGGSNHGYIRSVSRGNIPFEYDNPMSHEFGHMLGLKDKYGKNENGNKVAMPGWSGNIMGMATGQGFVEKKNLDILFQGRINSHNQTIGFLRNLPFANLYRGITSTIHNVNNKSRER